MRRLTGIGVSPGIVAGRAVLLMTELQADTVALAPDGPNVVRARAWLAEAREILIRPHRP